jgi:prepilin-type N-terminal cleavage/methylation domain-containing protein
MKILNQPINEPADRPATYSATRASNGFTLIEIMIGLAIALIGALGGLTLYRYGHETLNTVNTSNEMQQGIRKAFETMAQEIQETSISMVDVNVPNTVSFASAWDSGTFQKNSDGTPDWKYAVAYFWDSGTNTLCRYVEWKDDWTTPFNTASVFGAPNPEKLIPNITDLQFVLNGSLLEMTLTTSKGGSTPIQITTQIYMRN